MVVPVEKVEMVDLAEDIIISQDLQEVLPDPQVLVDLTAIQAVEEVLERVRQARQAVLEEIGVTLVETLTTAVLRVILEGLYLAEDIVL
jgi:hypothetical protein